MHVDEQQENGITYGDEEQRANPSDEEGEDLENRDVDSSEEDEEDDEEEARKIAEGGCFTSEVFFGACGIGTESGKAELMLREDVVDMSRFCPCAFRRHVWGFTVLISSVLYRLHC